MGGANFILPHTFWWNSDVHFSKTILFGVNDWEQSTVNKSMQEYIEFVLHNRIFGYSKINKKKLGFLKAMNWRKATANYV